MSKGYPRSRFEIIDQTTTSTIETTPSSDISILIMQPYTSEKGTEDWEVLTNFDGFTDVKGGISFNKHGQAQLTVANILVNGGYVLAKRMVSEDATLANTTIRARVIQASDVSYLYLYKTSTDSAKTFKDAYTAGYAAFNADNFETVDDATGYKSFDMPLFTVTPMGRGVSNLLFRIVPNYGVSRASKYTVFDFEIVEEGKILETISISMNPDYVDQDGVSQSMFGRISATSNQIKVKLHDDGFLALIKTLAATAKLNGEAISISNLVNMDYINGYDIRGLEEIVDLSTNAGSTNGSQWTALMPSDINAIDLNSATGISLPGGSFGAMGIAPVENEEEYTNMLLYTFGAKPEGDVSNIRSHSLFDPIIYDLDAFKVDAIFDCAFPVSVKNAIVNLCDFRGDMFYFADLGKTASNFNDIITVYESVTQSGNSAVYHPFFDVIDPYTKKQITVTLPYLLANKIIAHYINGIGRPFAGIANGITFPEIIYGTLNYIPVIIPGLDEKQEMVDHNINYVSYYDGTAVLETEYVNKSEYTQLSFLNNILSIQAVIKAVRTRCPRIRYTFINSSDLEAYIEDVNYVLSNYRSFFRSISCEYLADKNYERNKIFYAAIKVQFYDFIQEEYFKIYAID